ncbi:MAG: tRNA (N(6)-L-threonylcarbamoyladenosine(37)-C(2))-methylthiotransferase MtaB [Clostridia bacterium]
MDINKIEKIKVAFYTLGCKVNQYETNLMKESCINNNYEIVDFNDIADIYIVNSCSVTNLATRKTRNILAKCKRKNENCITVLVGCYAEELVYSNNQDKVVCDYIFGNEEKKNIIQLLKEKTRVNVCNIEDVDKYVQTDILKTGVNIRESVKIEDGCNNFCSYCIIPYLRGRIRSRNINDILSEVESLTNNGVLEIIIVGIEIASYGKDLDEDITLIDVIEKINSIKKVKRIRLGSIEPRFLTDENIERLSKIDKLCNYFHISVQSLDNNVLSRMNRKYTNDYVLNAITKLRDKFINCAITCDLIVGFINESIPEFNTTVEYIKKIKFSNMNVFKFSKRKYTKAYNMDTTVTDLDKDNRSKEIIKLGNTLSTEFMSKFLGKKEFVLFEEFKDGYLYGYTTNYIKVKVKGSNNLWKKVVEVELISLEKDLILGILV